MATDGDGVASSLHAHLQGRSTGPIPSAMRSSKARAAIRGSALATSASGVHSSRGSSGDRISIMFHPRGRQTWTGRGGTIIANLEEPSAKGEEAQPPPPDRTPSMLATITTITEPTHTELEGLPVEPELRPSAAQTGMPGIAPAFDGSMSLSDIASASAEALPSSSINEDGERV